MLPAAGEEGGVLGKPPQPAYPRISALRLDGVPWKYPFVPLKIGVFQQLRDSMLEEDPYAAHGWFISRQNPVLSLPDRQRTLAALASLDFIATVDIIMNDTAWFSDVVLPEASYLERYDPLSIMGNRAFIRQPVIEPQGEAKSALWIYKNLGERLGISDFFQYEDEEDYLRQQLAPLGVSLEEVRASGLRGVAGAATARSSAGRRPAARSSLNPPRSTRPALPAYPSGRSRRGHQPVSSICSPARARGRRSSARRTIRCCTSTMMSHGLWMNTQAAADQGLRDNDMVEVTSDVGKIHVRLLVTQAIRPDCVYMMPGFGHLSKGLTTAYGIGASDSDLHVTYTDPISGGQALTQTFVTVKKV